MLITCDRAKVFVKFFDESMASVAGPKLGTSSEQLLAPLAAAGLFRIRTVGYRCFTDQVLRIIKAWPPEYLPYCHPFLGCLFLGPAAIHARVIKHDISRKQGSRTREQCGVEMEIVRLALSQLARTWKFGALLLGKLASLAGNRFHSLNLCGNRPCGLGKQRHS